MNDRSATRATPPATRSDSTPSDRRGLARTSPRRASSGEAKPGRKTSGKGPAGSRTTVARKAGSGKTSAKRAKASGSGKSPASRGGAAKARAAGATRRDGARPSDVSDAVYVAPSALHGLGMFAARAIPAGTLIGRLVGMPTHDDGTYVLWVTDELGLELIDDLRFINHDASPNCALSDIDVTTLRDIAENEELTHDYGWR